MIEEFGAVSLVYSSGRGSLILTLDHSADLSEDDWDAAVGRVHEMGYEPPPDAPDFECPEFEMYLCNGVGAVEPDLMEAVRLCRPTCPTQP